MKDARLHISPLGSMLCVLALAVAPVRAASAEMREPLPLNQQINATDGIFHGVVTDVRYRMSEDQLPHTFVTYQVRDTIAGSMAPEVTLRFIGGTDGRGGFFGIGEVPIFNVGDEDILLVRNNGASPCPLTGCAAGRLRIHSGKAYNADGIPLVAIRNDKLAFRGEPEPELRVRRFPTPRFDDLIENPEIRGIVADLIASGYAIDELRVLYQQQAPSIIEMTTVGGPAVGSNRPDASPGDATTETAQSLAPAQASTALAEVIATLRRSKKTTNATDGLVAVKSTSIDAPFHSGLSLRAQSLPEAGIAAPTP